MNIFKDAPLPWFEKIEGLSVCTTCAMVGGISPARTISALRRIFRPPR